MGMRHALVDAGLDADEIPLILGSHSIEGGRAAGQALIAGSGPLPEAIFVATETMALGLLDVLRTHGLRVPEDVALVTHDGLPAGASAFPSLTTIAPPRGEMGGVCVDALLRMAAGESIPPLSMLEAQFIVRESTAGVGAVPRQGLSTPLSATDAWSQWRTDPLVDVTDGDTTVVTRTTLGRIAYTDGGEEVMSPDRSTAHD